MSNISTRYSLNAEAYSHDRLPTSMCATCGPAPPSIARLMPTAWAIEVTSTGAKLWRYRYRHNGKASMLPLGEYPDVKLAAARRARDEACALLVRDQSRRGASSRKARSAPVC